MGGNGYSLIEDEPNIIEAIRFIRVRDGWAGGHGHSDGRHRDRGPWPGKTKARPSSVLDVMLPRTVRANDILADLRADPDTMGHSRG